MHISSIKSHITSFRIILALILALSTQILTFSPVSANSTFTVLDTLGTATTSTQFQLTGSGGFPVYSYQQLGPMFVLTKTTEITEIGVFVTYCELLYGAVECPSLKPIEVQIRPAVNGQPDLSKVLGTFVLPKPRHPEVNAYQSVHPHLTLRPGTYFAIFAPHGDGSTAGLLSNAILPFSYQANSTTIGFIFQPDGRTGTGLLGLAVRILGKQGHREDH